MILMDIWQPSAVQKVLMAVFGLVLIIAGIRLGGRSHNAQYHETARTGFNVFVSIVIVAIGLGSIGYSAFGKQILTTFGIGTD